MGKGPSGAGDTPARGAGVMSISSALDAAKAEFARNVKDSEEVMETLEVTSLAEIREVSAEIVAQNRENARRALEKASATVGGGAWVSPTSGDALVAPLAGSRRAADKAKRRSSKTRDGSGKDKDKSDGPRSANVSEPSPLAKALDSPVGVALRRAAAREPPELDAVEERSAGLISPAAARGWKKVLRRVPAPPPPEPVAGEPLAAALAKHASVAPVLERAQRLRREAEEKAERARRARGGRQGGGGGQDGARAARGGARRRRGAARRGGARAESGGGPGGRAGRGGAPRSRGGGARRV